MYCIKLSILSYQLFVFNDFYDLETFRASDKRTSSDFNKYLKYLNIFKITSSNNGYRPTSPKKAIFIVLLPTPRENLQNLICTFSCFMFLLKLNRKRSSLLILLTIDVPHSSLPYNSTGVTVWSNMCKSVFIFGLYKLKLFPNLNNAFNLLLYKSSLASAELPLELIPKYLYPFALLIGTLFTLNIKYAYLIA